ncbi:FkbM family methyltransferase [Rhodoferax sediminis]|uniref:FkbM family methyltransferase n=1 Tax=Rhodoferax sediminis TaxID=2509614 RepID=A0A515D863_9BURK|nr:FkbM family methyltransferase [Rhodoferax sediminis]QDL36586.1 FkbM family methyltransferase [Rhodoferax sediminis]
MLKQYLKSALIRLARSREYELIPAWSFDRQPLARHLRAIFERYNVDCVFDVGGNLGQYHDLLREEVGFKGLVFSFEPVSKYIDILREKSESDQKWQIFDFALGSAEGSAPINVTKSPGLNSFLEPQKDVVQNFWPAGEVTGIEQVRIRVLDSIFEDLRREHSFHAPYLKLDTQGFDLEVLRGSKQSLIEFRALQTEASIKPLYQGMPDYRDIIEHLAEAAFELSGMFPVSHDEALRLIEFDCLLINRLHTAA